LVVCDGKWNLHVAVALFLGKEFLCSLDGRLAAQQS
jgi:hypothetical protein